MKDVIPPGRRAAPNVVRIRGGIAKEAAKDILNKIYHWCYAWHTSSNGRALVIYEFRDAVKARGVLIYCQYNCYNVLIDY